MKSEEVLVAVMEMLEVTEAVVALTTSVLMTFCVAVTLVFVVVEAARVAGRVAGTLEGTVEETVVCWL